MKKLTILLMVLLLTGCTIVRIDTTSIDNILNVVLSKENTVYNKIGKGYKYYLPRGVTYIDTIELNDKLYSNGVYYYLYIDVVGYFYKSTIDYETDEDAYYYKKIDNSKSGYLKIIKENDKYKIVFVYNYSKIEAVVEKSKIEEVVLNASYILSTVKLNEKVIELMLNDDYFTNKEEQYDLFTRKETENYFLVEETAQENIENWGEIWNYLIKLKIYLLKK